MVRRISTIAAFIACVSTGQAQNSWWNYPNNTAITVTSAGNVGIATANPGHIIEVAADANVNDNSTWPIVAVSKTIPSKLVGIGCDPSLNVGFIVAGQTNIGYNPLLVNPHGGNVGIGTTNPQYPLSVNGTVQAKEVLVNSSWSDYVFGRDYQLAPLAEVGAYIQTNHHLPGIPSDAEVQQSGVSLGDMQSKLLAKIEELTLHMIAASEKNEQIEQRNRDLEQRLARLEAALQERK